MKKIKMTLLGAATAAVLLGTAAQAGAAEKIAIAQFGIHPQLQEVVTGFKSELARLGHQPSYEELQVNFDTTLVPQMVTKLLASDPQLMLTITTSVSQGAKQIVGPGGIPLVFAAVTDPVAAKLVPSWEAAGDNMTGMADYPDAETVVSFIQNLLPKAKRIGVPFNPGEANDVSALEAMKAVAAGKGLQIVELGIDNINDISMRVSSLAGRADVIYVPGSNLIQPAIPAVAAAANGIQIPVVNSVAQPVLDGLVPAGITVSYEKIGARAADLAAKILDGTSASTLPPMKPTPADHTMLINKAALAKMGIEVPASLADCNCFVGK